MKGDKRLGPKFEDAKRMRLDRKGSCEGPGFSLGGRSSDLVNLLFCLVLGTQIQSKFPPGFFERRGSFNRTILYGAFTDIVERCNQLPKKKFFTKTCNEKNELEKIKEKMKKIFEKRDANNIDSTPLVLFNEEQLKCLKQILSET